ncbi:MAG: serine hydrolase [Rhodothermales bacterium]|nr:serine hydrolase [Rhodothermales bacterium]
MTDRRPTSARRAMRYLLSSILCLAAAACGGEPDAMPDPRAALRDTLETLLAQHPEATVAVAVRDPETDFALDLRGDRPFHAASTMKVPVMIEVFRQAEAQRFALGDALRVENRFRSIVDGSAFRIEDDSDDAIYARLGETMTVRDLVYQMITVSSNLATNLLIDFVSADTVQATSERLGTTTMRTLRGVEDLKAYRQGLSNSATAADLATLLERLMQGTAVSPEADRQMVEILHAQRFNTMIPAGLPEGTRVAHKTGWITEIHHDAAIVYPEDGAPYVLVVLTEGIADEAASAALGAEIARAVHAALRPGAE